MKCSSCGAEILWASSVNGKSMPLNLAPDSNGRIVLSPPEDPREPMVARLLRKDEQAPMPRFTSHFATCPQAAEHRRSK